MIAETIKDAEGRRYYNWVLLEIAEGVEASIVEQAWKSLVEANEALRTGFVVSPEDVKESEFLQVVYPASHPVDFSVEDGEVEEVVNKHKEVTLTIESMHQPPLSAKLVNGKWLSVMIYHGLFDGWAMESIVRDLAAYISDPTAIISRPQFRKVTEYAKRERDSTPARTYWTELLKDVQPVQMPNLTGRRFVPRKIAHEKLSLKSSVEDIEAFARSRGITPQVLLQTAWAWLLGMYTESKDVVFGTVVSGRTIPVAGVEDVIGVCINTLPTRVGLEATKTIAEVFRLLQKDGTDVLEHVDLPLRAVKALAGVEAAETLFDTILVYQKTLHTGDEQSAVVKQVDGEDRLEYTVLVEAEATGNELELRVTYEQAKLPAEQCKIMLAQLDSLVDGMMRMEPTSTLDELVSMLGQELVSVVPAEPVFESMKDEPKTMHEMFELTAKNFPEKVAIEVATDFVDGTPKSSALTYEQLNARANQVANYLVSEGSRVEEIVAINMDRSIHMYVAILAVLKAGGAYMPIIPQAPKDRVEHMVSATECRFCLTTSSDDKAVASHLPASVKIIEVDVMDLSAQSQGNMTRGVDPSALAYVFFTSGTTGTPKGVCVEHGNVVYNLAALTRIYPYGPESRFLQFSTFHFDVSVFEIFFAWKTGMVLCTARQDLLLRDLEAAFRALRATHSNLTPTAAGLLRRDNVPSLEVLICVGEEITDKIVSEWHGRRLFNGYGPTEATNICHLYDQVPADASGGNIGRVVPMTSAYILSNDLKPVPRGAVGELCVGGPQVTRGYLKMPELTAQKFFELEGAGRVYKTGDFARLLPDGSFYFLGRRDGQVKIRGFRIELGEISASLSKSKKVNEAITIVVGSTKQSKLVSFVVPTASMSQKCAVVSASTGYDVPSFVKELFDAAQQALPFYMVPSAVVLVSHLPLGSTNKVDKAQLLKVYSELDSSARDIFTAGSAAEDNDGGDWSDVEISLRDALANVSGVDVVDIGRSTSIYKLGLDSISAIRLSQHLRKVGFHQLDVSQIMRNPTIRQLAGVVSRTVRTESSGTDRFTRGEEVMRAFADRHMDQILQSLELSQAEIEDILICTPLQEGMLGDSSRFQGSYYNHAVYEVTADVDLKRLEAAWRVVVERHPMMRTCFCITEDPHYPFAQVVLKKHQLPWSVTEISGDNLLTAVDEHIACIGAALDVRRPPYHFGVLRASDKTVIVHSVHHAIYDGWANGLVDDDVKQLYAGGNLRERPAFRRVLEYIASTDETESIRFWKQNLEGYEPTGFPDLSGQSRLAKGSDESVILSKSSSLSRGELEAGCQALSTTLLAVVQSAWTRILTSYLDSTDVVFGNVVSGRTLPIDDVQEIAGPCFNTIPVRATLSNTTTNRELVQLLQNINAESLPHQHTSLRKIIKSWDESSGKKLFDTLIIFQNATDPQRDSVNLWKLIDDRAQMDFIAAIEFMPSNESLEIQLSTWKSYMPQEQANVLLEQLDCAMMDVLKHPDSQAADFSAALPDKLLSISNSDAAVIPVKESTFLHTNLERYAREVPDRVALEFWDGKELREWTYAQLNAEANKVANCLLELGVERDEAVPLCMEKSPQLYICILGILKAGAAFTPLDTSAPIDRKVFMITELEARFSITMSDKESSLLRTNLPNLNVIQLPHAAITQQSTENPSVPDLKPSNLAYILYTSGSTGRPKAVAVEIRNAVQAVLASRNFFWWNHTSKFLQFAAPTFDMSIYDCMISWNFGIRLCSATRKLLLSDLHGVIQRMNVTHLDLTPTIASSLIRSEVPTVEMLFCIGEALPQDLVEQWSPICINAYGPTECAMACTHQISMPHMKSNNIGKPFESTSLYILTKDAQHIVPVHGVGELCIGGFQVARGYHANPVMTEDRFITRKGVEGRLYRTGDLVRVLANGEFEFLGRADDQVKIRGLRVELGEINAVARDADSSIVDAITLVLKHPKMLQDQLVTFLALQPRDDTIHDCAVVTDIALRLQLTEKCLTEAKRRLPAYMIPGIVLLVDRIPLSAAGKVNRRLLTSVFTDMEMADFQTETKDEDEVWGRLDVVIREALAQIALVPLQDVRKSSTIFQLGLDSISAVQVAARLSRQLHREVSVLDVLQNTSIRELSAFLQNASASSEATVDDTEGFNAGISAFRGQVESDLDAIPRGLQAILPCTPLQEGMLAQFIRSNGKEYFNSVLFELEANIDIGRLRSAWNSCFENFDILRTGFCAINGTRHSYAQLVYERAALELPWSKHDTDELNRLDAFVEQRRSDLAQKAIDALEVPPINLDLISGSDKSTYLLFSAHHALFDAWSLGLLLETVYAHYHGFATPERSKSASVLRSILSGEYDEAWSATAKTFWKSKLEGISPSIFPNLTSKRLTTTGSFRCIKTSKVSFAKMEAACKSLNVQVQTLGQAAWAKLLSAYSGETHVIFGQVLSGRAMIKGGENAVFPCLTTVPCAFGLNGSNKDFVQLVQQYNSDSLRYQHTSLTAISQWLGFTEGETLFDTIFLYQKAPAGSVNVGENELWREREHMSSVDYAVSLEMEPMVDGSVSLVVHAKDSLMSAQQGELLLEQFDALLEGIIDHPEAQADEMTVADDNLLSISPPQHEILDAPVQYLHHFVEMHAKSMPGKVAFEFATGINGSEPISLKWTYAELNEEGNRIAHYLRSTGVKPNTTVPVCFDKSPIAFFSILGVLKAGCSFLALDPGAPMDRRAFIVKDISAIAVLTIERYADAFRSNTENVNIIAVDVNTKISLQPSDNLDIPELAPESLAYILYTSGSTGTPKGCEISHDNAVQAMQAFSIQFAGHWDSESKFLCFASLHFDVSILEQYWTWSVGIAMVAADRDLLFQDLPLALRALRITHLDLTPSLAVTLQPADVPLLRVFITGGELLRREVLDSWGKTGKIFNAYGPTEVTIGCTMLCSVPEDARPSNIGKQFVNCGSFVVKAGKGFTPVLRGAVGELCMSGKLVGRGYVKRPELTAERFLEVPEHNVRVYRTGDLVRLLDDGSFDFIGRADEQVKLRGQRLELGEINATLKQAGNEAAVVDAATLVLRHPSQQKDQLVSFIVPASTATAVAASPELIERFDLAPLLRQACKRRLPRYMIPTHILPVSKLPLSRTNKIDGKFLAALFHQCSLDLLQQYSGATNEDRVKAWTETGRRIQQLLARITKVPLDAIHPSTSIFELGLDSISAVNFAKTLKKEDIGTVSVSQIMQNPCIMDMADLLETPSHDDSVDILSTAKASIQSFSMRFRPVVLQQLKCRDADVESIYPCTPLQEGIIAEARQSDNGLYFNHFILRLEGLVDTNKLHKALEVLIQSNAMLRTCFCDTEEGFAQVCLRWQNSNVKLWKEVILKDESVNEVAEGLAKQFARDNKSLERPAFGIYLVGKDGQKCLCLVLFHALYDGWSLPLLLDDLQRLYHGIQLPQRPPFEGVVPHILAADEAKAKDHWRKALNGMRCMSFPVQHSDSSDTDAGRSDFAVEVISDCSVQDVEIAAKSKLSSTPQALLQAACSLLLTGYLGKDVSYGVVVSGRNIMVEGIENVVGPVFNTIPFAMHISEDASAKEIVKYVQTASAAASPFHHTPLRLIRKWLGVPREFPLFDFLFVYQKTPKNEEDNGAQLWDIIETDAAQDFSASLEIEQTAQGTFVLRLAGKGSVLSPDIGRTMLQTYDAILSAIISAPNSVPATSFAELKEEHPIFSPRLQDIKTTSDKKSTSALNQSEEAQSIRHCIAEAAGLDVKQVDDTTSIFHLGLDSIEAIRLSAKLRLQNILLSVSELMKYSTVQDMLRLLNEKQTTELGSPKSQGLSKSAFDALCNKLRQQLAKEGVLPADVRDVYPCTPLQEGMIAESSGRTTYLNHAVLELDDGVDAEKLKQAWKNVLIKEAIFSTSFRPMNVDGVSYAQVVHETANTWSEHTVQSLADLPEYCNKHLERTREVLNPLERPPVSVALLNAPDKQWIVLCLHHALYDGWSLSLLFETVLRQYHEADEGSNGPSFKDVVNQIVSADQSKAEQYWSRVLDDCTIVSFPDLSRSTAAENPVGSHWCEVNSAMTASNVEEACKYHGITLQTIGQAAWAVILSLYTGESDVLFGAVLSGRNVMEGAEGVMGPTMNTVPVRVDVRDCSNLELLRKVHDSSVATFDYQHTPLRDVQRLARTNGRRLFDTIFLYQKSASQGYTTHTQPLWTSVDEESSTEYSVAVEMETKEGCIIWRATSKNALMTPDQTRLMLLQLDAVVKNLVNKNACNAAVIGRGESTILAIDNASPAPLATGGISLLHEFFEKNAAQKPEHPALEFYTWLGHEVHTTAFTYEKLNALANQVARLLVNKGVQPGDVVPISIHKDPFLYIGMLGILKAGGALLFVDPDMPQDRKSHMVSEVGAKVLLVTSETANQALSTVELIELDTQQEQVSQLDTSNLNLAIEAQRIAYMIYTSGTTGTPKGVTITHTNAVQAILAFHELIPSKSDSRFLQFASAAFDVIHFECHYSWSLGITLCSASKNDILSDLERALNTMRITHVDLTPSVSALVKRENVPTVEVLVSGGEALTQKVLEEWTDGGCLYNAYGPSEVTIGCTMLTQVPRDAKPMNIGKVWPNTSAYVLSSHLEVLPRGAIGELCVGSVQVVSVLILVPSTRCLILTFLRHPAISNVQTSPRRGSSTSLASAFTVPVTKSACLPTVPSSSAAGMMIRSS
ncbi:hypothetical protein SAICODRAFT_153898 [Saitoella complicata NRRL Y-17804]|uniref:uncharacterized protein n=1 Tax=Saitoella complicata (strain BCRC 22490 / CBS 7301 / JCM 7358 / NBRC 10748 / NRRL Y-17804) TaxID=698492 RepID=UPI0008675ADD|nr:uncharacterized protein SAICODRAFT_153898 [Saitoella complicata NRRL Y-17804]ODQ55921.1 hypothetical protein SAICODRAFT_153898 [Saitoella complicata NRRL Y-17804]